MKYDSLKSTKSMLIAYLQIINLVKSKVNFGKESFSIKIEFAWKDTIKNEFYYSNNIAFEYYSVMFNLATIHCFIVKL
jgi:hypothetical protein